MAVARSFTLMFLAPPFILVLLRFWLPPTWPGSDWAACIAAGSVGMLGIIFAPWREPVKVAAAGAYMLTALVVMPFLWVGSALALPRPGTEASCASRFSEARAAEDARAAIQQSDLRVIKIINEAVVVTVEAPGLSAANCADPKQLALEDDATSRLLNEGNFREDSLPTACEEAARKYAEIYNQKIVELRPKVLAGFCASKGAKE